MYHNQVRPTSYAKINCSMEVTYCLEIWQKKIDTSFNSEGM